MGGHGAVFNQLMGRWNLAGAYLVVLGDEMEFLVRFLEEEDDVGEDDHRHQLHFAPGVIQVGHSFEPAHKE